MELIVGVATNSISSTPNPSDSKQFKLGLPTPNPFNPSTRIDFRIDGTARTSLRVYDIRGYQVKTLVDEELPAGDHTVHWDGTDDRGMALASGTYFATLSSGADHTSSRLALVK